MKKLFCFLLIIGSLFSLSGCNKETPEMPVNFYYPLQNNMYAESGRVFAAEIREAAGFADISALIAKYLKGPKESGMMSPFPAGTKLIDLKIDGSVLSITLTDRFATLSGLELTLACAGLSMTCMELTGTKTVLIQTIGSLPLNGTEQIVMDADSLLFLDDLTTEPVTATIENSK